MASGMERSAVEILKSVFRWITGLILGAVTASQFIDFGAFIRG